MLNEMYSSLKNANFIFNLEKCHVCLSTLKYLGFVIDLDGLRIGPDKVSVVLEYPRHLTVTQSKRFLYMQLVSSIRPSFLYTYCSDIRTLKE